MSSAQGRLVVVATPIGNLADISERALEVLRQCDRLVCENPTHSQKLLSSFAVTKKDMAKLTEHTGQKEMERLLEVCVQGGTVAYITDAGTPTMCDPGGRFVDCAHTLGVTVSCVPGCCAVIAAVSMSGYDALPMHFHGFFPQKTIDKQQVFSQIARRVGVHVCYESPHRLQKTLAEASSFFGSAQEVFLVKEISKMFERYWRLPLGSLLEVFAKQPPRGEFVWVMRGPFVPTREVSLDVQKALDAMLSAGLSKKTVLAILNSSTNVSKNDLYAYLKAQP